MEIGPVYDSQTRPTGTANEKREKSKTPAIEPPADRVEISREARIKLAALADKARRETLETQSQHQPKAADVNSKTDGVKPDAVTDRDDQEAKIEKIQRRIKAGFYDLPEVKEETAGRLADQLRQSSDNQE